MIYVDDQKRLDAHEIEVLEPKDVKRCVGEGFRILAMFSSQVIDIVQANTPVTVLNQPDQYATPQFSSHDVPVVASKVWFVMGRSKEGTDLAGRLETAESEYRNAEQNVLSLESMRTKAEAEIESLKTGQRIALENVQTQTKISTRAAEKLLEIQRQAGLVRKEIGEARWREILHALEIEDVLGRSG